MCPHEPSLVHAHPDDETIGSGTTMARYAAAPDTHVTLVTCTLGEEGEILLPAVSHLAADQEDRLGEHRMTELADAMAALGVTDWRLLGGAHRYRDSGMMGTSANERPDCFWRADLLDAAAHLVAVIREVRPQVLVTYDDFGGYGHPDHIQAHRVAMYAVSLAEAPSFRPELGEPHAVAKVYWTAFPKGVIRAGIEALRESGQTTGFAAMDPEDLPFGCEDALVTTAIEGAAHYEAKLAAMRAHATQIALDSGFFALSNNIGSPAWSTEFFRLVRGSAGGPLDGDGREADLFGGL
ncbi:MAG: N-acetyl-1-D-myo-inositol-2-amino-2-deoxy-alpha-D-glucopyranoside deacetylase [Candidatus Nanopelagicales bacterium]|nr:N-acetyl-1-D-myo-inositol-2-amino-2-deoxy-alpha-D-glucopyranoside deacetylase [Candidatus Nanopelagicales bacterium]